MNAWEGKGAGVDGLDVSGTADVSISLTANTAGAQLRSCSLMSRVYDFVLLALDGQNCWRTPVRLNNIAPFCTVTDEAVPFRVPQGSPRARSPIRSGSSRPGCSWTSSSSGSDYD